MEKITTAIIGGGASGLLLATSLQNANKTVVFERGERVGKKLSATGNGQGNVSNVHAANTEYFSLSGGEKIAAQAIARYDSDSLVRFFENAGLLLISDERGRVYPAGRQASALGDALRNLAAKKQVELRTNSEITDLAKRDGGFVLTVKTDNGTHSVFAENVVLCAGGNVARSFGTDGTAYALAQKFGHTLTALYPSLVQLKADMKDLKTLKGIRVADASVTASYTENGVRKTQTLVGDIMFADYGVSGDAVFRLSAFVTHRLSDAVLSVDFLPTFTTEHIYDALVQKRKNYPQLATGELLCGFLNNQIARVVMKRANGDLQTAAQMVKAFQIPLTGHMGNDLAQVTKGGIRMDEVDENLQSKLVKNLYFAGEIVDIDGPCGGFNLQWAYSSARVVAAALDKQRGQV